MEDEVEGGGPGGESESDGDGGDEMERPLEQRAQSDGRKAAAELDDEGSSESPGNPQERSDDEEAEPGVMHAFAAHDEDGLEAVNEAEGGPDGGDRNEGRDGERKP
jgi:hypothetical protein